MDERMDDGWVNGCEDEWEGTWVDSGCMDGRMNGWISGE